MRDQRRLEEANNLEAEIRKKTNGEILLQDISKASLQQRFEESMQKVKDTFVSIASGPLIKTDDRIGKYG